MRAALSMLRHAIGSIHVIARRRAAGRFAHIGAAARAARCPRRKKPLPELLAT
jgi:hypothetical protein